MRTDRQRSGLDDHLAGVRQGTVKDDDMVHTKDGTDSKTGSRQSHWEGELLGRKRVSTPCRTSHRTRHLAGTWSLMEAWVGGQMDSFF